VALRPATTKTTTTTLQQEQQQQEEKSEKEKTGRRDHTPQRVVGETVLRIGKKRCVAKRDHCKHSREEELSIEY